MQLFKRWIAAIVSEENDRLRKVLASQINECRVLSSSVNQQAEMVNDLNRQVRQAESHLSECLAEHAVNVEELKNEIQKKGDRIDHLEGALDLYKTEMKMQQFIIERDLYRRKTEMMQSFAELSQFGGGENAVKWSEDDD